MNNEINDDRALVILEMIVEAELTKNEIKIFYFILQHIKTIQKKDLFQDYFIINKSEMSKKLDTKMYIIERTLTKVIKTGFMYKLGKNKYSLMPF